MQLVVARPAHHQPTIRLLLASPVSVSASLPPASPLKSPAMTSPWAWLPLVMSAVRLTAAPVVSLQEKKMSKAPPPE
jgi:hypothetical protein